MRNPDYQFLSVEPEALEEEMKAEYERICGLAPTPASPEMLFIKWVCAALIQERVLLNWAVNQNIPSRAEGEHLDALAELFFHRGRTGAVAAGCTVRFYISQAQAGAVLIQAGTRVTDGAKTLYWQTTQDAYLQAGETYIDLAVECMTPGAAGNGWGAGQLNTIVDVYDYYSGCENTTASEGGADAQTDEELYEAMRLSMDALTTTGPRGGYIYHAKAVSAEIADVEAVSPSPGEVRIYALMKDGSPAGEAMKAKILEAVSAEDVRPLTDHVEMDDPVQVPYNIDLSYYVPQESTSTPAEIETAVEAAVEEYVTWQSTKMGRDINPSKLIGLVMQAGAERVELIEPAYISLAGSPPKAARLEHSEVRNGGYGNV